MAQRLIDLTVSILGSATSLFLSWPYFRDFEYWAESPTMWRGYFLVGFLLAVYVFYVFLRITRTLFEHDELERAEAAAAESGKGDAAKRGQGGRS